MSPSSRRAWIEIIPASDRLLTLSVALLAEGVDRNFKVMGREFDDLKVALLAEGVDRNSGYFFLSFLNRFGRPPRGGRG